MNTKKVRRLIEHFEVKDKETEDEKAEPKKTENNDLMVEKVNAFNILMEFKRDTPKKPSGRKKVKRLKYDSVTPVKNRKIDD